MCMITSFLQYVAEGRVVRRQSDLQRYTFQEITERIYLSFLTLALLKNFSQTKNFVKSYLLPNHLKKKDKRNLNLLT